MNQHILHITGCLIGGGAETHLRTLCLKQLSHGYNVSILYLYEHLGTEDIIKDLEAAGAHILKPRIFHRDPLWDIFTSVRRSHLIHAHLAHTEFWALLLAVFFRKKLILNRYLPHASRQRRKLLSYFSFRYASAIICISQAVKKFVIASHPAVADRCHTIYLGLNPDDLRAQVTGLNVRRQHDLGNNFLAVIPARLARQKGLIYLLRAIKNLNGKLPGWIFLLIGEGPERQGLESFVKTNGLMQQVKFAGFQKNIYDFINQADLVLLPSLYEGFGLVLLEAMCFAKPIVTTTHPAIFELVGDAALCVSPGDTEELQKALYQMTDEKMRAEYGEKSYRRAELFTADRMFHETERLYQQIHH